MLYSTDGELAPKPDLVTVLYSTVHVIVTVLDDTRARVLAHSGQLKTHIVYNVCVKITSKCTLYHITTRT